MQNETCSTCFVSSFCHSILFTKLYLLCLSIMFLNIRESLFLSLSACVFLSLAFMLRFTFTCVSFCLPTTYLGFILLPTYDASSIKYWVVVSLSVCLSVYNLSLLGSLFHSINWPVSVSTEVEHVSTEYNIVLRLVENVFIFLQFCSKNSIILCLFSFLFVSVLFSLILFFLFLFIFLRFILALSLTANKK